MSLTPSAAPVLLILDEFPELIKASPAWAGVAAHARDFVLECIAVGRAEGARLSDDLADTIVAGTVTQPEPGWHVWTTPTGRTYTQEPWRYIA